MNPLCIYHGHCADGFGAAWVVDRALKSRVEFYPGVYQDAPPENVNGRLLIFVDFCYKRDVMKEIAKKADAILVLDHHKSAMDDMKKHEEDQIWVVDDPRADGVNWAHYAEELHPEIGGIDKGDITAVFDLERSGAGLAWDFFFPGTPRPRAINHIEDRDLWKFELPDTRAVQANLFSLPYDLGVWDQFIEEMEHHSSRHYIINAGQAIERKHHKDVDEMCRKFARPMRIGGYTVPVANIPYTMTSDAGHLLCGTWIENLKVVFPKNPEDRSLIPFAACYWDTPEGRVFSLRSREDGADVSEIAKKYGGGGHAHASGFRVPYDRLAEFEP